MQRGRQLPAGPVGDHLLPVRYAASADTSDVGAAAAARLGLRFLDTGCVYGRELTGWLVEEDRLVSVPARQVHWPRT